MFALRASIAVFLCFLVTNAFAQQWRDRYQQAVDLQNLDDLKSALALADEAIELYKKESGETNDNYTSLLRLAQNIAYADGQIEKALDYVKKELAIREAKQDIGYAEACVQKATFYMALEDPDNAEKSLRTALNIFQQFLKPDDPAIVDCQLALGINYFAQGKASEAYALFSQYLPKAKASSFYIQASYYQGEIHFARKDFKNAIASYSNVREFYDSQESKPSEYALLLSSIAQAQQELGEAVNAEESYKAAQAVLENLEIQDESYLQILNLRATNLQKLGRGPEAENLIQTLASVDKSGAFSAAALNNKAAMSQASGDFKTAETLYKEALAKLDKNNPSHKSVVSETLQNYAMLLSDGGRLTEAVDLLKQAESILVSINDPRKITSANVKMANVYLKLGDNAKSKQLYRNVISSTKTGEQENTMAVNGLGAVFQREGNLRSADSLFQDLFNRYNAGELRKDFTYPVVLNNFAALNQQQGQFFEAQYLFRLASNHIKTEKGIYNIEYATSLENLAFVNLGMGQMQEAKPQIDSVLSIYEKLLGKESLEYADALIDLGKYYQNSGDYPSAEPCFKNAYRTIQTLKSSQQREELISAIHALAIFYQTMGNYEEAEPLFKQARETSAEFFGKNSADYSTALQNLATLYQIEGKLGLAAPMLEESLAIDEKIFGNKHPQYAIALRNLAAVYQKLGKLENAQVLLERALSISEAVFTKNHPSYALSISNLAALYQDRGNFKAAEQAWLQSVDLRKKLLGETHPDYARSLYGLATNYFAQANFKQANIYYRPVVEQYLKQIRENFPSLSEKEKGAFYAKIKPVFESFQDFCVQFYKATPKDPEVPKLLNQLYQVQLITKALLLNSSNKVRQSILSSGDESLIKTFHDWLATKEQIVRYYGLSVEERKLEENVAMLEQRANELEKSLSLKSSLFKNQLTETEISPGDIVKALEEGEAAAEIIRIKRKFQVDSVYYVALILRKNSAEPSVVLWQNGNSLENRRFKFHRNSIKHHFVDTVSYDYYWKPLVAELTGVKNVFLSCDGIFNKINFNTLLNRQTQRWVLDDYTISLVSNTKDILNRASGTDRNAGDVNLYGNVDFHLTGVSASATAHPRTRNYGFGDQIPMLPGTEKEVDQIQSLLVQSGQHKAITYKMQDANEINLKKTSNPAILHIATHGFFLNDVDIDENAGEAEEKFFNNPLLRSGLLLAGAGEKKQSDKLASDEDGILTAYEAMNLSLDRTDLVVLSACETGLGEVRNGEGVYGLQRSFMVAGSNAVMMSLWQVDDAATQELMVQFYKHWMEGDSKLVAFKKAQLHIKEKYKSPYYWGAFILVGI